MHASRASQGSALGTGVGDVGTSTGASSSTRLGIATGRQPHLAPPIYEDALGVVWYSILLYIGCCCCYARVTAREAEVAAAANALQRHETKMAAHKLAVRAAREGTAVAVVRVAARMTAYTAAGDAAAIAADVEETSAHETPDSPAPISLDELAAGLDITPGAARAASCTAACVQRSRMDCWLTRRAKTARPRNSDSGATRRPARRGELRAATRPRRVHGLPERERARGRASELGCERGRAARARTIAEESNLSRPPGATWETSRRDQLQNRETTMAEESNLSRPPGARETSRGG
jgi:hypothetical protein